MKHILPILMLIGLVSCSDPNIVEVNWPNGQLMEKRQYAPNYDREEGRYKVWRYDEQGKLLVKGEMVLGKKDGDWLEYYPNGNVKFECAFQLDKRFGKFILYYENGKIHQKGEYVEGEALEGEFTQWDEKGELLQKGTYSYGLRVGRWTTRLQKQDSHFKESYFSPTGKLMEEWEEVSSNAYQFSEYWSNGGLKVIGKLTDNPETFDLDSLRDVIWKVYNTGGNLILEKEFTLGVKTGEWKWWNDEGDLSRKESYMNGELVSNWEFLPGTLPDSPYPNEMGP